MNRNQGSQQNINTITVTILYIHKIRSNEKTILFYELKLLGYNAIDLFSLSLLFGLTHFPLTFLDAQTVIGFLKEYGLDKDFKLNIEPNHSTLAGHDYEHDIEIASRYQFSISSFMSQTNLFD